jgi:GNAT superfamily N-acetyltransferase
MKAIWSQRLGELMEDWRFYIKSYPWQRSISTIYKEFLQLPYRRIHYLVFARSLAEPVPEFHFDRSIVIRKFESVDIHEVEIINRPSEAKSCTRRFAKGHVGVSALHNGHLVGYAWAFTEIDPVIERFKINLGPRDFLCTDAFTSPSFRGRGIQTSLALTRLNIFRELGFQRALCYIERKNQPSIRVWEKIGAFTIGDIEYFRVGPWRWITTHPSIISQ